MCSSWPTTASAKFDYDINQTTAAGPTRIRSSQRIKDSTNIYVDTYSYLDGFGRDLQTQTASPIIDSGGNADAARILTSTGYDHFGRVVQGSSPYRNTGGAPGAGYAAPTWNVVDTFGQTQYDTLDRETAAQSFAISVGATVATKKFQTATTYDGWTRTIDPPVGGNTDRIFDGRDHLVETREHNGSLVYSTKYEYALSGDLKKITDANLKNTTFSYDLASRRIGVNDPNMGDWSYTYDKVGNLTSQTDARNQEVHFIYDWANRLTERHSGSAAGPLLSQYTFYTANPNKGLPHEAQAMSNGGTFIDRTTDYDAAGMPTAMEWQIPDVALTNGVDGTYKATASYFADGSLKTLRYPLDGNGALGETTTYERRNIGGLALRLSGTTAGTIIDDIRYDEQFRPTTIGVGLTGAIHDLDRTFGYDVLGRVDRVQAGDTGAGSANVQDLGYSYSDVSNIAAIEDYVDGGQKECFDYDDLHRLTDAGTRNDACTTADTRGTAPYTQHFEYDEVGNFTSAMGKN